MNSQNANSIEGHAEVPTQIFEKFLAGLEKAEIPADLIDRLRTAIITKQDFSDEGLRAAMFLKEESDD